MLGRDVGREVTESDQPDHARGYDHAATVIEVRRRVLEHVERAEDVDRQGASEDLGRVVDDLRDLTAVAGVAEQNVVVPVPLDTDAHRLGDRGLIGDVGDGPSACSEPSSSTAALSFGSSIPTRCTRAPSERNKRAVARPIPLSPPVINATLPSSPPIVRLLSGVVELSGRVLRKFPVLPSSSQIDVGHERTVLSKNQKQDVADRAESLKFVLLLLRLDGVPAALQQEPSIARRATRA